MGSHIACTKLCRIPILLVRREGGGGGGGIEYKISVCTGSNYRIPHTCISAYAQVKCISNHRTYKIGYHIALPVCIALLVYICFYSYIMYRKHGFPHYLYPNISVGYLRHMMLSEAYLHHIWCLVKKNDACTS